MVNLTRPGLSLYTAPPPGSGAVLAAIINIMENFNTTMDGTDALFYHHVTMICVDIIRCMLFFFTSWWKASNGHMVPGVGKMSVNLLKRALIIKSACVAGWATRRTL